MNHDIRKLFLLARASMLLALALLISVCAAGCSGTGRALLEATGGKNVNIDGFLMYGVVETNNPETAAPTGKLMIGEAAYRSRKVDVPAAHKVPDAGYYRHTRKQTLFGTVERTTEFDWTASDPDAAGRIAAELRRQAAAADDGEGAGTDSEPR